MGTYTRPISVAFGAARSGQVGNVGYRVVDAAGTTLIARTTTGVTERTDAAGAATTGVYEASVAGWDTGWHGRILWDITGQAGVAAEETFDALLLDLTQVVPTSNTAQTLGDALNAARAGAFGKWTLSGTTLTLYAPDGTTVVRAFTLDNAVSPTQRV